MRWEYKTTLPASWEIYMPPEKSICKEIKPVIPKENKHWIFIGRTDADPEAPRNTLVMLCEELTHWKRPWCWERLSAGGEGGDRGWDGCMASLTQWTWVWANPGDSEGQGSMVCSSPWGCRESDTTWRLNNNHHIVIFNIFPLLLY